MESIKNGTKMSYFDEEGGRNPRVVVKEGKKAWAEAIEALKK
jgi:hypothetical protein